MKNFFQEKIRVSAVADQFYPGEKEELDKIIDSFLKKAKPFKFEGKPLGLIVPHAGYIFSGQVAATGFKSLGNENFETIILIGDSHYERFDGVSVWSSGEWETPLGRIEVDEKMAEEILSYSKRFLVKDSAHLFEHSLEVQIPFLQKIFKKFKILPIIFGSEDKDWETLAKAILNLLNRKKILIVASSDLSHYPPYEKANLIDKETIEGILSVDPKKFSQKIKEREKIISPEIQTCACAQDSIKTLLEVGKKLKAKATLLEYKNSGDSPFGEKFQVVGYGSILFYLTDD